MVLCTVWRRNADRGLGSSSSGSEDESTVIFAGIAFLSFSIIVEALSVWVYLTAAMRFMVGVMTAFMQIVLGAIMMKLVEESYIGRVNGTITPLLMAGTLTGSALAGPLMKSITLVPVYGLSAIIILIAAFASLSMKLGESTASKMDQSGMHLD